MNPTKPNRDGVCRYRTRGPKGLPFTLVMSRDFHNSNTTLSHFDARSVTFKDGRGNYAEVVGVRNPEAWVKRHGYAT